MVQKDVRKAYVLLGGLSPPLTASAYRKFADLGELIDEAKSVYDRSRNEVPGQQSLFD